MSATPDLAGSFPVDAYALAPPLAWFALPHAGKSNEVVGLHTGAGDFIARRYSSANYRDPAALAYEEWLLALLVARDLRFSIPLPQKTRDGALHCRAGCLPAALIPAFAGLPLALGSDDGTLLGFALGALQDALRAFPATPRPGRALFAELFDYPAPRRDPLTLVATDLGLADDGAHDALLGWWRDEAAELRAFTDGPYRLLPMQLCHNDITPNNVLAEDGRVTAVLDFEFATIAPRALDFATGLRQSIRHWLPGEAWAAVRPYCRGYARAAHLTPTEIAALPALLRLRGALTALWWLSEEPAAARGTTTLNSIANCRRMANWLEENSSRLIALVAAELER